MNRLLVVALVSLAPCIGACSKSPDGSGSSSASNASGSDSSARAQVAAAMAREKATPKACDLVTAKEMSAILGSEVAATAHDNSNGKTECIYQTDKPITHSTPYADLSIDWGDAESAMDAAGFMNKHEPGIADPYEGIGDKAVAVGPTLMIKTGEDLMTIILSDVDDVPGTAKKIFNTAKPRM